jgi:hypothetical protein
MKKLLMLFAANVLLFTSCIDNTNYAKIENEQQLAFDKFLKSNKELEFNQANEIQKKEFFKKYEHDLYCYVDSMKLLKNWKGVISKIDTEPTGNASTLITFTITYQPEKFREVTFNCMHIAPTDSLKYDVIYNEVKDISDYSQVYFDGIIRVKNDSTISYDMRRPGDDLNISYPKYDFFIVDVRKENNPSFHTKALIKAIDCSYRMQEPLKLNYLKLISKKEKEQRWNQLLPEYEKAKKNLSENEIKYIGRVNESLTLNFLYGSEY